MVSSKFSFRFYLGFIIAAAPLTFGLYGLTHPSQMIVIKHGVTENGSAICYVLVGVGLWSLAWQLFNASTLKVWSDRIGIKHLFYHTTVLKEDIITIDLLGRMKGSAFDRRSSFIIIDRKQGKRILIPDRDYRNTPGIKRALQLYYPASPADQALPQPISDPEISDQQVEKFAGKWFLSGYGMSLCFLSLFAAVFFFGAHSNLTAAEKAGLTLAFILLFYFPFGSQLYYFEVSGGSLVVKNHFYPWYTRTIRLADIRSAAVENPSAATVILHITTKDFQSPGFSANSLREPQWKALMQKFKEKGIPVVNEAYW